jgi:hypothetical protein
VLSHNWDESAAAVFSLLHSKWRSIIIALRRTTKTFLSYKKANIPTWLSLQRVFSQKSLRFFSEYASFCDRREAPQLEACPGNGLEVDDGSC